jgi:thiol:disulfide interchange protein DsbC
MIKRMLIACGLSAALLAPLVFSPSAQAQKPAGPEPASPAVTKQVKAAVETWLKGRFKVDAVSKTPMPGLVEVRIGQDILYAHENGQFALVEGQLIELKSGNNLTAARMEVLQAVDISKLPLELALKTVQGDGGKGKRTIVVFEDPYCSFCRKFRAVLLSMENVTIYTYFYPILRAESTTLSKNAWCAKDREAAWEGWMMQGKEPAAAPANCDFPKDKILALGQGLGVQATPTTFVSSGKRLQGALSKEALEAALKTP